ncbi:MAG: ATP phosphoribosyltransferase regulatory subunit [Clostridia bacterium]|nr:ATP phosphoribosyltransferase regulatory subunit [Clostridia bacterium]
MLPENLLKNDERAMLALRSLYNSYGYRPFKMSKFEEYELYVRNKDFLVSDRVITFNDTDGRLLALKPDVTLSIIKNTRAGAYDKHKVYYNENVYRVSGTTGQFKEIMQMGLECIGDIDTTDVFEVVSLAAKSLATVSSDYVLDISHMGIISAFIAECERGSNFTRKMTALISEKNSHEVYTLCEQYGVPSEKADMLASLIGIYGERSSALKRLEPLCTSEDAKAALCELASLDKLLTEHGITDKVRFDFSVVNNMNYYNGIVFKGFLAGISEGVLAGGAYDNLLRTMKQDRRGIGFALYLDLLEELEEEGDGYDVDVLLVYDSKAQASSVAAKKDELISQGLSVYSATNVPEKIRYKKIVKVN